jgi:hypothetical protein
MIVSTLISQLRREYGDDPKSIRVSRNGDGVSTLFNLTEFPVIEGSYSIYVSGISKTESTDYSIDLDNGDLILNSAPGNNIAVLSQHKYAHWRDAHWLEAINKSIETLNGRGFFRQAVRFPRYLSANVRTFSGPSACVDIYEILQKDSFNSYSKLNTNWSYQQDDNKIVLGSVPSLKISGAISYLRNMQPATSTSSTIDVKDDWLELIKAKAGAIFYRSMAGKIAKQGNATVDEGHFSFTNLRAMANDLDNEFNGLAARKKPSRPTKDIQWHIDGGGIA